MLLQIFLILTTTTRLTYGMPLLSDTIVGDTDLSQPMEFDEDLSGDFETTESETGLINGEEEEVPDKMWKVNLNVSKKGLLENMYQGDIKLSILQELDIEVASILSEDSGEHAKTRQRRAARSLNRTLLWKDNTIYYKIDSNFQKKHKLTVKEGIKHWKRTMKNCLRFTRLDRNKTLEAKISREKFGGGPVPHILFTNGDGCWSQVGRVDTKRNEKVIVPGQQQISLGDGCHEKGTVIHEIGHAVGFWHEQSRRDRSKYIRILEANMLAGQLEQFQRMPASDVDSMGYAYDFWSVMHYGEGYFSKRVAPPKKSLSTIKIRNKYKYLNAKIGQRQGLSYLDIAQVRAMYKCNKLPSAESKKCVKTKNKGRDYRGRLDYTESGVMCQPWNKQWPHKHNENLKDSKDGLGNHNHCRNPQGKGERPWCYTTLTPTDNKPNWEYCDVKLCSS